MASAKKKAMAKSKVKFKDLKSKKNPKGGFYSTGLKKLELNPQPLPP